MTPRVARLRNKTIDAAPSICKERGRIITDSYLSSAGEPICIRRALALRDILSKMSIVIDEDELLVGNHASRINAAPLFPEFSIDFLVNEIDDFARRPYDRFDIDEETKQVIREIAPYWRGNTHEDLVIHMTRRVLPEEVLPAWEEDKFRLNDILYNGVRKSAGDGHVVPNYFRLLEEGIPGILAEADAALLALDYQGDAEAFKKKMYLDSVKIAYRAIGDWFLRFAEKARELAAAPKRAENRETLEQVAMNCENLAAGAPKTFWEAIQLVYFAHLAIHIESNGHSVSLGRIDQYLYPFYQRDVAAGALSEELALCLIECFYIKTSKFNKVRPWPETRNKSGAPMFMTVTLGGQTREDRDASNELTHLFLDGLGETKLPQPTPIIRVFEGTTQEVLVHGARTLMQHGGGLPAFFSDEAIVDSLTSTGVPLEDAREYAIGGCSEAVIPGKSFSFCGGDCYFNLVKILETQLNEGKNPRTGFTLFETKKLEEYKSLEDVLEEYRRILAKYMSLIVPLTAVTQFVDSALSPTPFTSGLIDWRIAMGRDMSEGGGKNAAYSHTILQGHGTGDVCNSLYALDQFVFQKKELTLRELTALLNSNWAGAEGEELHQMARKMKKYGNDMDEVDRFAVIVSNMFADEAAKYTPWRGGVFGVSLQGLTANVPEGETVGATPDGRVAGEALSDNISPHAGTDLLGPTSTLKSVSKVDHARFLDGNILNLRFHPSTLLTPHGDFDLPRGNRFADMIKTYLVDLKGNQVQFNILSSSQLREAQKHPEENRDLVVKVAGYSAYFNSLDKGLQDQIIERTEHSF